MRILFPTALAMILVGVASMAPARADGENQFVGTIIGAGLGGVVGNQFGHGAGRDAATAAGVVFGGLIGNSVGRSFDDYSSSYYTEPGYVYYPGPVYFETTYVPNYVAPPAADASPSPYYDATTSDYCREFTEEINVDGHEAESYGTACLQPDGSWRVVQ